MSKISQGTLRIIAHSVFVLISACGGGGQTGPTADTNSPAGIEKLWTNPSSSLEFSPTEGTDRFKASSYTTTSDTFESDQTESSTDSYQYRFSRNSTDSSSNEDDFLQKTEGNFASVWRFYNSATGAHFMTASTAERDSVIKNLAPPNGSFKFEGEAFKVSKFSLPKLAPVYRFYNSVTGVHFYTISEAERSQIANSMPHFIYEGIAYYASLTVADSTTPLYRFYIPKKGFHFYTASLQERNEIIGNLGDKYTYEGVGYWVMGSDITAQPEPPAKIPHSGIRSTQCFVDNSLAFTHQDCSGTDAKALNPQQDGHRTNVNAMSFSLVGPNLRTSCVKDNVTDLVWEGKTSDTSLRNQFQQFTNLGNGFADDTSGYVKYINSIKLCGYNDWRLPTSQELVSIVNYGRHQPSLDKDWFPNWTSDSTTYWTGDIHGRNTSYTASVTFSTGWVGPSSRSNKNQLRLVRGTQHKKSRFSYASVSYGNDTANNLVTDAWTGLTWRRCEQGRTWSGSTCTGTPTNFNHPQALVHVREQTGWRLPNVKELASLLQIGLASGATIDPTAFPGAYPAHLWSSTPTALSTVNANFVDFSDGDVNNAYRFHNYFATRLVRESP